MGTRGALKGGRTTLVYDSACPACSAAVDWIGKNAQEDAFEMVPCQSDTLESRFPEIPRAACMGAMQLVLPDGTVLSGEQALPEVVARLRRYRGAEALFRVPGVPPLSRVLYRWFAEHRYRIARLLGHSPRIADVAGSKTPAEDRPWQRKTS